MFFLINYYFSQSRTDKQNVALVVQSGAAARRGADKGEYLYTISRPNTGLQLTQESLSEIKKRFRKITPQKAEPIWKDLFNSSKTNCSHIYWLVDILRHFAKLFANNLFFRYGNCRTTNLGIDCQFGLRQRTYNVLSGSVLIIYLR